MPWSEADNKRFIALVQRLAPFGWSVISVAMGKSKGSCTGQWTKLVRERDDLLFAIRQLQHETTL